MPYITFRSLSIIRYARALITWTYDHIIYSRRAAIQNIYDYCKAYKDPESFRERINNYLRISENTITLDAIVANPNNWGLWFEVFFNTIKSEEGIVSREPHKVHHLSALHDTCRRYLESYQDITGINLAYVLSGLICDDYNDSIDGQMFDNCLETIGRFDDPDRLGILEAMLGRLQHYYKELSRENLKAWVLHLLSYYPNQAAPVYKAISDDYSLMFLIQEATSKIHKSMEMIP